MLADNYLARQIDAKIRMLCFILLKCDAYEMDVLSVDSTFMDAVDAFVAGQNFGGAEDLLFERLTDDAPSIVLQAAFSFYIKLNRMRDVELEMGGFSREEILEGLDEIGRMYGVETEL